MLGQIQESLAKISYGYKIKLSDKLNRFVSDFDRIDDVSTKERIYSRISSGEYLF
jgi:hypothetical protein